MTSSLELLEVIENLLRELQAADASADADVTRAYKIRIALNLLGTLKREQRRGGVLVEHDVAFASEVPGMESAVQSTDVPKRLAQALRDARIRDTAALRDFLRERCLLALAIDNPRYSGYMQARERWPELSSTVDARLDSPIAHHE